MEFERGIKSTNSQHEGLCRCSYCIRLHCCKFYIFLYQFAYELIILIIIAFSVYRRSVLAPLARINSITMKVKRAQMLLGYFLWHEASATRYFRTRYATIVQLLMLIEFKFYYFHRRKLYTSTAATMTSRNGSNIHASSSLIWFRDIDYAMVRVCAFKR